MRTKKANRQGLIEAILCSEAETIHPPKVSCSARTSVTPKILLHELQ